MAQTLGDLPVGAKVKAENSKWYGQDLIFRKLGEGHSQDPTDSIILQTNDIITVRCFDAMEPSNSAYSRRSEGNNRYLYSNLLQWLNSDAGAGEWWTAQHEADMPPNSGNVWKNSVTPVNPYATQVGFMNDFTDDFKNSLLTVTKRTAKASTDAGGYEDVQSKFFLLSTTEVGLENENNIAEGELYSLFSDLSKRIMAVTTKCANNTVGADSLTTGEAWYWWLRTPRYNYSNQVRLVMDDGTLGYGSAFNGRYGIAPACAMSKNQKVSNTVDEDGCYTLIYEQTVDKPTMLTTSYKVTKSEITPKLDGYDSSTMTLSGDTSATNIGFYTLSITPKEGYTWSDDSSIDPVDFAWDIYDVGVIKQNNVVYGDTSELESRIEDITEMLGNFNNNVSIEVKNNVLTINK